MINWNSVSLRIIPDSVVRIPDVSDEDYFGDKYREYISNSNLKHLNPDEGGSAYNFNNRKSNQSNSLELGSAVHRAVLEGDKFVLAPVSKPSGKLAEVVEYAYKLNKEYPARTYAMQMLAAMYDLEYYGSARTTARADAAIADGKEYYDFLASTENLTDKIILSADNKEKFMKAVDSIKANTEIQTLLKPSTEFFKVESFSEDVITADVEIMYEEDSLPVFKKIPVKCKIDNWTINHDLKEIVINDLKTTSYPIQNFMGRFVTEWEPIEEGSETLAEIHKFLPGSFQKWHYQRQMSMYSQMLLEHCKREYSIADISDWTIKVNMIVAETCQPFNAYSFEVTQDWLDAGQQEYRNLMARLAWHMQNGFDKLIEL